MDMLTTRKGCVIGPRPEPTGVAVGPVTIEVGIDVIGHAIGDRRDSAKRRHGRAVVAGECPSTRDGNGSAVADGDEMLGAGARAAVENAEAARGAVG